VQPPQSGDAAGADGVAEGVGRTAEGGSRGVEVVLEERGLGLHRPDGQLLVAGERRAHRRREHLRGFGPTAAFERGAGAYQKRLQGG